ncbi:oxidoreductase-like domain-containing protein [Janthinobacterium psychrotolerans]|uniref:oxidoreductase-like domain-containing protein n=1 Tax=Janthinobacterium psychrotolerans TaxID=1747903 RepID=UPI0009F301C4|nr:oxidoreductase-like domain-containing protein [Janthinobacterium psychrotolerans]
MSSPSTPHDPPPPAPVRPGDNECCQSGCTYCILDMYQEELASYRDQLRAWEQRQPPAKRARQHHPS